MISWGLLQYPATPPASSPVYFASVPVYGTPDLRGAFPAYESLLLGALKSKFPTHIGRTHFGVRSSLQGTSKMDAPLLGASSLHQESGPVVFEVEIGWIKLVRTRYVS